MNDLFCTKCGSREGPFGITNVNTLCKNCWLDYGNKQTRWSKNE